MEEAQYSNVDLQGENHLCNKHCQIFLPYSSIFPKSAICNFNDFFLWLLLFSH